MRLVVKVGTSLIAPGGRIDTNRMRALVDQLDLSRHEYLIVSSGAIASGMTHLGLRHRPSTVPLMQACAAVGQSLLMHTYEQLFFGKKVVAQLLLSSDDFTSPIRYRNLQNALHELLKLGVVPVVNENDSVSVRELVGAFGDNDELSALLATAVNADWLLLLTDVDGFYFPNGKQSRLLRTIRKLTAPMEAVCNGQGKLGTGGMRSKLRAAKLASEAGANVAIANGRHAHAIPFALERKIGTYFHPNERSHPMATSVRTSSSTRDKLLRAQSAAARMAELTTAERNAVLVAMADAITANAASILEANQVDLDSSGLAGAMRDRLLLTPERIAAMVSGVREVASLPDPVGETIAEWVRPNGLRIRKVRVPLGVVGVIYESRPNVTVDTASLVLKTGNAIVLRGGKEAVHSNHRLVEILNQVDGIPEGAIELLDSSTRDSVHELIKARGLVDVLIPRGGPGLISFVADNATVPVIETGAGNCHIYVDESADFEMADRIVINAKTQRPSVCNAAEKLLVHQGIAAEYVPRIVKKLLDSGVEVRGDDETRRLAPGMTVRAAEAQDWSEEYLRLCIAIRVVDRIEDAISHINRYSTKNSEAIVTGDERRARLFLRSVDSAVVYWNASTRFSDGGEFGFGAEMGISTQKLHCRGPFALAELTSAKYEVTGNGQVR